MSRSACVRTLGEKVMLPQAVYDNSLVMTLRILFGLLMLGPLPPGLLWQIPMQRLHDFADGIARKSLSASNKWRMQSQGAVNMLLQVDASLRFETPAGQLGRLGAGEEAILSSATRARLALMLRSSPSPMQESVSSAMVRCGMCDTVVEVSEERTGLWVDALSRENGIIVELHGAVHFFQDGTETGRSQLRVRLLRAAGWRVVVLPGWQWPMDDFLAQRVLVGLLARDTGVDVALPG